MRLQKFIIFAVILLRATTCFAAQRSSCNDYLLPTYAVTDQIKQLEELVRPGHSARLAREIFRLSSNGDAVAQYWSNVFQEHGHSRTGQRVVLEPTNKTVVRGLNSRIENLASTISNLIRTNRRLRAQINNLWARALLRRPLSPQPPPPILDKNSDLVVITHQTQELELPTADFLAEHALLRSAPKLVLASVQFPLRTQNLFNQTSEVHVSAGGEAPEIPDADRYHLFGGDLEVCLTATIESILSRSLRDSHKPTLEIYIYSTLVYPRPELRQTGQRGRPALSDLLPDLQYSSEFGLLETHPLSATRPRGQSRYDYYLSAPSTAQVVHIKFM